MRGGIRFATLGLAAWLCCFSLEPVQGGKLLVLPVDGSHWLSMKILVKELVRKGHEILVLVPETSLLIKDSENYKTEIYKVPYTKDELDAIFKDLKDGVFSQPSSIFDISVDIQRLVSFTTMQVKGCDTLLNNRPLMTKLRDMGFEAVLSDPFLPCGPILAHLFSIPAIHFLHGLPCGLDAKATQCPTPPSYVPASFSHTTDTMTFPERVKNFFMSSLQSYLCTLMYHEFDKLVDRQIEDVNSYKELLGHGAFWLIRSDFTFDWPKPIMPNTAFIGGINCAKKAPLPADLETFVNDSGDDGFIVFTLGSMVPSMPEDRAKEFFDAFRQIPQKVLWRYTGSLPADVPKNVKLMKWLPQNDLLAHPKAKLFITHGGTHGIYESICNAVPMLMFPLFGDQGDNVHHMKARGVAKALTIHDVTSETLLSTLKEMTQDKSYKEKILRLSKIHHDRPVGPLDLGVFWTEFIMRHKGAAHLRVAAHELNWIQYHSLDVFGLFIFIVLTVLWVSLKCCMFCTRKCLRRGTAKRKNE